MHLSSDGNSNNQSSSSSVTLPGELSTQFYDENEVTQRKKELKKCCSKTFPYYCFKELRHLAHRHYKIMTVDGYPESVT